MIIYHILISWSVIISYFHDQISSSVERVGYDPAVTSISSYNAFHSVLSDLQQPKALVPISENLVDLVWNDDGRPPVPRSEVVVYGIEFAGVEVQQKLAAVREKMVKENVHGVVLSVRVVCCSTQYVWNIMDTFQINDWNILNDLLRG